MAMQKPKNYCTDCETRYAGCHSKCLKYQRFQEELSAYNSRIITNRNDAFRIVRWTKTRRRMVTGRQQG